ncbi:MAG: phage tail protein [Deltaproteobacteria bacterium]|nr:MAG: phage tail protein [Deltaproteobacteria bacterium]
MPTEELFGAYNFLLEISGITGDAKTIVGGFKSVSGMDSETEVIEFKQGNDRVVRKKPGRTTYANITLERGFTATDDLFTWRNNIEKGIIDRRSGSVIVLDQDLETEVARYNFYEAWPCKWMVPEMDSESSATAIEKIELAVEKVERA